MEKFAEIGLAHRVGFGIPGKGIWKAIWIVASVRGFPVIGPFHATKITLRAGVFAGANFPVPRISNELKFRIENHGILGTHGRQEGSGHRWSPSEGDRPNVRKLLIFRVFGVFRGSSFSP
jgi:hypothetical protein